MASAMTAGAAATGARAYLAARRPSWLSPLMLKRLTACLLAASVLGAGLTASHQSADAGGPPAPVAQHR